MRFEVRFTDEARADVSRLLDYLVDQAETLEELAHAMETMDELESSVINHLSRSPFTFRKAGMDSFVRELVVPAGSTGCVVLYEIQPPATVMVGAVRHQREEDYR
jgi:plasmid stabilization system protein ParE